MSDKHQFLTIWYTECMERGAIVLKKLNEHDYVMEDVEEQKSHSGSTETLCISTEDRIEMFKYFMNKYEFFEKSSMLTYIFMVEFLTVLHPREFSFFALHQAVNEGTECGTDKASIVKELLLHVKKFFRRRNLKPKMGYLKKLLEEHSEEAT